MKTCWEIAVEEKLSPARRRALLDILAADPRVESVRPGLSGATGHSEAQSPDPIFYTLIMKPDEWLPFRIAGFRSLDGVRAVETPGAMAARVFLQLNPF